MRRAYVLGLLLIGLLGLAALVFAEKRYALNLRGTVYEPPPPAHDFSLVRSDGQLFRLHEHRGKVVLLYFGYTSCPDVCPTILGTLSQAVKRLDRKLQDRVQVVFITVDPQRDTPEKAQNYAQSFFPSFIGLSGTEEQLQPIWTAYEVYREIQSASNSAQGYPVDHSTRVYLIDSEGYLRLTFAFGTAAEDIAYDLRVLLSRAQ